MPGIVDIAEAIKGIKAANPNPPLISLLNLALVTLTDNPFLGAKFSNIVYPSLRRFAPVTITGGPAGTTGPAGTMAAGGAGNAGSAGIVRDLRTLPGIAIARFLDLPLGAGAGTTSAAAGLTLVPRLRLQCSRTLTV